MTTSADCNCPKCNSPDWKLASLVHAEGAYAHNLQSSSTGVSVGSAGLNIVKNATTTTGSTLSAVAKLAAPPTNMLAELATGTAFLGTIIAGAIGYYLGGFWTVVKYVLSGLGIGLAVGMVGFWKSSNAQFDAAMKRYTRSACARAVGTSTCLMLRHRL